MDKKHRRLARGTADCLSLLSSFMAAYEKGDQLMYIAMAGQLRILLFDTNRGKDHSLLGRLSPSMKLMALKAPRLIGDPNGLQMGMCPYEITKLKNGVVIGELEMELPPDYLSLDKWRKQIVTPIPRELTISQIIRAVADKGGGAHLDDEDGAELAAMRRSGPTPDGIQIPFTIAIARYALKMGKALLRNNALKWGINMPQLIDPVPITMLKWEWTMERKVALEQDG